MVTALLGEFPNRLPSKEGEYTVSLTIRPSWARAVGHFRSRQRAIRSVVMVRLDIFTKSRLVFSLGDRIAPVWLEISWNRPCGHKSTKAFSNLCHSHARKSESLGDSTQLREGLGAAAITLAMQGARTGCRTSTSMLPAVSTPRRCSAAALRSLLGYGLAAPVIGSARCSRADCTA